MLCTNYSKNKYVKKQIEIVPKCPDLWGMAVDWDMSHLWDISQVLMMYFLLHGDVLLGDALWPGCLSLSFMIVVPE